MSLHEIVLPETKPETEWVRGRALGKVSPTYSHARLQMLIGMVLTEWADAGDFGRVGSEWRFRITPPGEMTRPLVPDVAYLSYVTVRRDAPSDAVEVPSAAPTLAVEILSPDDRARDVDDKIRTYLAAGTAVVILVEPLAACIDVHDRAGRQTYASGGVFRHDSLPGFSLDVGALFARASR
jgi:Uma2 family endonuclease